MSPVIVMSDWSKLAGSVFSRVPYALTEARQQPNQSAFQQALDPLNIDLPKIWADILSALGQTGRLVVKWWGIIVSSFLFALIAVNSWSIVHPYVAAGALILISVITNIGAFLVLLEQMGYIAVFLCLLPGQLEQMRRTAVFLCFFPVQLILLIIWGVGFRSPGVAQGSLASQSQSRHYGSTVRRDSRFAYLQSFGAIVLIWPVPLTLISLLSYAGALFVLGREWGWWLQ